MEERDSPEGWEEDDSPHGWATAHAEDAYLKHRGERAVFGLDEWVVIYDAHPYVNDPGRRGRELAELRDWLQREAIGELAFAEFPESGDEKGFAFAMVLDTVRSGDVHAALNRILGTDDAALNSASPGATAGFDGGSLDPRKLF